MLEETYQQTGNIGSLRRFLPDLDRILSYYDSRLGWWEFVDWQPKWGFCGGIPEALLHGPSVIINLMYALALEKAAVLWDAAGRPFLAAEYRARKKAITDRVFDLCWDAERGMLREGPDFAQFTQHAQSWAVLTGMLEGQAAKTALRHAIDDADVLKCGFSTAYEWFRALEQAGMYEETARYMRDWAALPAMGNTTCPEVPGDSRSECHAWSAVPLYEFLRVFGGIRMEAGQVVIAPVPGYLESFSGHVCIPGGAATFRNKSCVYTVTLPNDCPAVLRFPDGSQETVIGGTHQIQLK